MLTDLFEMLITAYILVAVTALPLVALHYLLRRGKR